MLHACYLHDMPIYSKNKNFRLAIAYSAIC